MVVRCCRMPTSTNETLKGNKMKTNKVSTLRANGFSVCNCSGNICRIASSVPFKYGEKVIDTLSQQRDYRLDLRGHVAREFCKFFETI